MVFRKTYTALLTVFALALISPAEAQAPSSVGAVSFRARTTTALERANAAGAILLPGLNPVRADLEKISAGTRAATALPGANIYFERFKGTSAGASLEVLDLQHARAHGWDKIDALPNLKHLDLRGALGVTKAAVAGIAAKAKNLEVLSINAGDLTDFDLRPLASMTSLRTLSIEGGSGFKGVALADFLNRSKLTSLSLRGSGITANNLEGGEAEGGQDTPSSLETLDLSGSQSVNSSLVNAILGRTPSLRSLRLADTAINDAIADKLAGLAKLEELDLSLCSAVSDELLATIGKLKSLRILRLSKARLDNEGRRRITDAGIQKLLRLENLRVLDLGHCAIGAASLYRISLKLKQLEEMDLSAFLDSDTFGDGFKHLADLTGLRVLRAEELALQPLAFGSIGMLRNLERLDLGNAKRMTDQSLRQLQGLTRLKELAVDRTRISDDGLEFLRDCTALEVLDCSYCPKIKGKALERFPALRELYLHGCDLGDQDIAGFPPRLSVQRLSLQLNPRLTGANFSKLKEWGHLQVLDLSGASLTGTLGSELAQHPSLQIAIFAGSTLHAHGLKGLETCASLTWIDLRNCSKLQEKDVTAFQASWKGFVHGPN